MNITKLLCVSRSLGNFGNNSYSTVLPPTIRDVASVVQAQRARLVSPLAFYFVRARDRMDQYAMHSENNAVAAGDQSGICLVGSVRLRD